MSYFVCHAQKFKDSDVRGMEIHNNRESSNSSNKDIDYSRTELNFDAITGEENNPKINYRERVEKILETEYKSTNASGSKRAIRENAVKMVSVMVSSDYEFFKDMPQERVKEYFRVAADELAKKFGRENVVAAKVHMDEKTPHMHFTFVPIKDGKLTAKEIITRNTLCNLQDELPKILQKAGFDVERGTENSPLHHIPAKEFKKKTAKYRETKEEFRKAVNFAQEQAKEVRVGGTLGFGGKTVVQLPTEAYERLLYVAALGDRITDEIYKAKRMASPKLQKQVDDLTAELKRHQVLIEQLQTSEKKAFASGYEKASSDKVKLMQENQSYRKAFLNAHYRLDEKGKAVLDKALAEIKSVSQNREK